MSKEFIKELDELAKKYDMEVSHCCDYCGRSSECLNGSTASYMVTFTEKEKNETPKHIPRSPR